MALRRFLNLNDSRSRLKSLPGILKRFEHGVVKNFFMVHHMMPPPLARIVWPVMKPAASLAKKIAGPARSSG